MEDFVNFVTNNWMLAALFVVLLALYIFNELRAGLNSSGLAPDEVVELINHQNGVVIDLRTESQFADGHIVDALHIPFSDLAKKLTSLQKHVNKPIILIGNKSDEEKASRLLKEKGFQVSRIQNGLLGWRTAGLPLTKKS